MAIVDYLERCKLFFSQLLLDTFIEPASVITESCDGRFVFIRQFIKLVRQPAASNLWETRKPA